jgi:hypothetical protein
MKTLIERIEDKVKYAKDCMIIDTDISVKMLEEVITALREYEQALERLGSEESMQPPFTNDSQEVDDRINFARNELNRIRGNDE